MNKKFMSVVLILAILLFFEVTVKNANAALFEDSFDSCEMLTLKVNVDIFNDEKEVKAFKADNKVLIPLQEFLERTVSPFMDEISETSRVWIQYADTYYLTYGKDNPLYPGLDRLYLSRDYSYPQNYSQYIKLGDTGLGAEYYVVPNDICVEASVVERILREFGCTTEFDIENQRISVDTNLWLPFDLLMKEICPNAEKDEKTDIIYFDFGGKEYVCYFKSADGDKSEYDMFFVCEKDKFDPSAVTDDKYFLPMM